MRRTVAYLCQIESARRNYKRCSYGREDAFSRMLYTAESVKHAKLHPPLDIIRTRLCFLARVEESSNGYIGRVEEASRFYSNAHTVYLDYGLKRRRRRRRRLIRWNRSHLTPRLHAPLHTARNESGSPGTTIDSTTGLLSRNERKPCV